MYSQTGIVLRKTQFKKIPIKLKLKKNIVTKQKVYKLQAFKKARSFTKSTRPLHRKKILFALYNAAILKNTAVLLPRANTFIKNQAQKASITSANVLMHLQQNNIQTDYAEKAAARQHKIQSSASGHAAIHRAIVHKRLRLRLPGTTVKVKERFNKRPITQVRTSLKLAKTTLGKRNTRLPPSNVYSYGTTQLEFHNILRSKNNINYERKGILTDFAPLARNREQHSFITRIHERRTKRRQKSKIKDRLFTVKATIHPAAKYTRVANRAAPVVGLAKQLDANSIMQLQTLLEQRGVKMSAKSITTKLVL